MQAVTFLGTRLSERKAGRPGLLCALLLAAWPASDPARAQDAVESRVLTGHRAAIVSLAVSGSRKLASCDAAGSLKLWDMETFTEVDSAAAAGISSLAFNGDILAVGATTRDPETGGARGEVVVLKEGSDPLTLESVQTRVRAVAMVDGKLAAGGATMDWERDREFGIVQLWGEDQPTPVRDLRLGYGETVHAVAFTEDRQWLLVGSGAGDDEPLGKATLWNLTNFEAQLVTSFRGVVHSVAFSGNALAYGGVRIVDGRKVGFVAVREFGTGKERTFQGAPWLNAPVLSVAFGADGEAFAAASGNAVLVWKKGEEQPLRLATRGVVRSIVFTPDFLAAGSADGSITVWTPREEAPTLPVVFSVVDATDGKPLEEVTIEMFAEGATYVGGGPAGTYRFSVPDPGRFRVKAAKQGYESQELTVAVGDEGASLALRLQRTAPTPQPRTLTLTVVDAEGAPIADPAITVSDGATRKGAGRDGTHTFSVPKPGLYDVTVKKAGYHAETLQVRVGDRDARRTIRLRRDVPTPKPLALLVKVVEAADETRIIKGARVVLSAGTVADGADGSHRCSVPSAGTYALSVKKDGYVAHAESVPVASGGEQVTVRLERSLVLTVVDDETNAALPGCVILIPKAPRDRTDPLTVGDTHGYALASGTYDVSVSKDGYILKTASVVVGGGADRREIRLVRAAFTLVVAVQDAGNLPVAGLQVVVPPGVEATETKPGSYAVRLRPGTYSVEVTGGAADFPVQEVSLKSADAAVTLAPGGGVPAADAQQAVQLLHKRLDTDCNLRVNADDFTAAKWKDLVRYDKDGNGELDHEELAPLVGARTGSALPALPAPGPQPRDPRDLAGDVEKRLDTNGDGRVDRNDCDPAAWERIRSCDRNGDGVLDRSECAALVQAPGGTLDLSRILPPPNGDPEARLDQLVRSLDRDANGSVDQADFEDRAWPGLRRFDRDGNGALSREELRAMLDLPPPPVMKPTTPEATAGVLTIRKVADR